MLTELPILIVDDQIDLLNNLKMTLEVFGYQVLVASDGFKALDIVDQTPVALILADIAMPGMNGYQLYKHIRSRSALLRTPFVFLTARSLDSDIRFGKEMGVDDYLTKPIEPEDLIAAIRGKLKRAQQLHQLVSTEQSWRERADVKRHRPTSLSVGILQLNLEQHRGWLGDQVLNLSAKEFKLLAALMEQVNRVVSPTALVQITHGLETDYVEASNLLRPLVRSLRRKLGFMVGETGCIENVRGVGYRLVPIAELQPSEIG